MSDTSVGRATTPTSRIRATEAAAAEKPAKRRRRSPYPHLFRLLHWVLPASLLVALLTGLSLHAVARQGWSLFGGSLPSLFWAGRIHLLHLLAATIFLPSLLAVLWVYSRRKVRRRRTHVTLLTGGIVMIASGVLLARPVGPSWLYWAARAAHAISGVFVLPVALGWHVTHGFGRFRRALIPAFHPWVSPRWRQLLFFLPVPVVAACLILNVWPTPPGGRELLARRISAAGEDLKALPWSEASPLSIELADGVGFDGGRTAVTLRALYDGNELFVQAQWIDPCENREYSPWEKTADGWQHLTTSPDDESVYYEDKFAMVFPTEPDWRFDRFGCAMYCHVAGDRPYGYKGSDHLVDVWHWKAVRTDPVGQVDDKYWLGFDLSEKDVGRHGDPKQSGGYTKEGSDGQDHPSRLPDDLSAIRGGMIPLDHAVEYSEDAAEKIPEGTRVPSIVASAFVGDRGDVRCQSQYENGRWTLWIRRKLDTGSRYDRRFEPGQTYSFGCAAFDHTSNRHAYGLSVYRLTLE
ncbi:MAG: ethylbenzene dehydrogenase-related protein [Planctomycetota bacterium]|jgi:hypothetical protein